MAQKIMTVLIDDLTGETSDEIDVETTNFALDGIAYEIDLGDANATELRKLLAPYIEAGRRASAGHKSPRSAPPKRRDVTSSTKMTREMSQAARSWARKQGITVAERGRIPQDVAEAYRKHLASL